MRNVQRSLWRQAEAAQRQAAPVHHVSSTLLLNLLPLLSLHSVSTAAAGLVNAVQPSHVNLCPGPLHSNQPGTFSPTLRRASSSTRPPASSAVARTSGAMLRWRDRRQSTILGGLTSAASQCRSAHTSGQAPVPPTLSFVSCLRPKRTKHNHVMSTYGYLYCVARLSCVIG